MVYEVGKDYEYKALTPLFKALSGDFSEKTIIVHSGVYDIYEEYRRAGIETPPDDVKSPDYLSRCVFLPPNTTLRGEGNVLLLWNPKKEAITLGESRTWSPLNVRYGCTVENIGIYCRYGRYCIHDDSHNDETDRGTAHIYRNVRCYYRYSEDMKGFNNTIGFGFSQKNKYVFENCDFVMEGCPADSPNHGGFYGHGASRTPEAAESPVIYVKNCRILGGAANDRAIRLQCLNRTPLAIHTVFEDCKIVGGLHHTLYREDAVHAFDVTIRNSGKVPVLVDREAECPYPVKTFGKEKRTVPVYFMNVTPLRDEAVFYGELPKVSRLRREKIERLKQWDDKVRSLGAELLLKKVLSDYDIFEEGLRIFEDENGRPYIPVRKNIYFSISHSGDYVAVSILNAPSGVDIEEKKTPDLRVADRFFQPGEAAYVREADSENRFYKLWTMKESLMKATGLGMKLMPGTFEIAHPEGEAYTLYGTPGTHWYYVPLKAPEGYAGAFCASEPVNIRYETVEVRDLLKRTWKFEMPEGVVIWPDDRTAGDWTAWSRYTYPELLEKVYDPLAARHPGYIRKESIGWDETGEIEMFGYVFEPEHFEKTVFLQSGVHAREEDAWTTLARMMQMIAEEYRGDEYLTMLHNTCKFVVVPVVNVWGITVKPFGERKDPNVSGLNLNRDNIAATQSETRAVQGFLLRELQKSPIHFAMDFHTTVTNGYGDYMLVVWKNSANEMLSKGVLMTLLQKNLGLRSPAYFEKRQLLPGEVALPFVGDSGNPGTYVWWWRELGIPGATVEYSDFVFDDERCTKKTNYICLENMLSQVLTHAYADFTK